MPTPAESATTTLLIGHGSPMPAALAEFQSFAQALQNRLGRPVRHCYLEISEPSMADGLSAAAEEAGPGGTVIVLPIFLSAGRHQKRDVPAAVTAAARCYPNVTFRYGAALGYDPRLVSLLQFRVGEALAADTAGLTCSETTVLVVGRGSTEAEANAEIARCAYLLYAGGSYAGVEYAFQAAARPDVAEGVRRCARLGARQVAVAPFILFTGFVYAEICRAASAEAAAVGLRLVQASCLGVHPLTIDVALQRLHEAEGGPPIGSGEAHLLAEAPASAPTHGIARV